MDYKARAQELVAQMTLEEKAAFSAGADFWRTVAIERLGIPSIRMTDGPHGLRLARSDKLAGLTDSVPATCFPTASALASSWNVDLAGRVGAAIAAECQANDVQVILGPGVSMKRSPLGGRNFEYYSEDPVLAGNMGAAQIKGAESGGVGTSLKHYVANSQEFERMTNSSEVDERTLHEVNLQAFEIAVRGGKPWSLMASYNKVNRTYVTESAYLLRDVPRKRWGYTGVILSDWGAVSRRVPALKAGLQLEMPGPGLSKTEITKAVQSGELDEAVLHESVTELLANILAIHDKRKPDAGYSADKHHALAREAAGESIVLLRNVGQFLPLTPGAYQTVAVIGRFAKEPRYQGGGSSHIKPTKLSNAFESLQSQLREQTRLVYAPGYDEDGNTTDELLQEARAAAGGADAVLVFAGLPGSAESEGYDRERMDLPDGHNRLIAEVAAANPRCAVVLMNGAAVTMPWIDKTRAVVEAWLTGQAGGDALADVLTGAVNPSGKLSETFPRRIEDTAAFPNFPSRDGKAIYGEGVFTGYRHHDIHKVTPLFPFGFGLSYTTFAYEHIHASRTELTDADTVDIIVSVQNTGQRAGKEVVQLYVAPQGGDPLLPPRPVKTLRAFQKVHLKPGEHQTLTFTLGFRDFAFYDAMIHDWRVPAGTYNILVGGSSADLPLEQQLSVKPRTPFVPPITSESTLKTLGRHPVGKAFHEQIAAALPEGLFALVQDMPLSRMSMLSPDLTKEKIEQIAAACNTAPNAQ
jgi:beta-glucosidase